MKAFTFSMLAGCMLASAAFAADPIKVMLLDGESAGTYHKWKLTTPVLVKQLEETKLFQVDVVSAPPAGGDYTSFKPDFKKYAVEFVGTFFLVATIGFTVLKPGDAGAMAPLAIGSA